MKNQRNITPWLSVACIVLGMVGYLFTKPQVDVEENLTFPEPESELTYEYSFRNEEYLEQHYDKHGVDMGYDSAEEYLAAANQVVADKDTLHAIEEEDGDDVYYLENTNEFVVISTDGYIRTYFCPDDGIDYFYRQGTVVTDETEQTTDMDGFEYYCCSSGSSSVSERYMIYVYEDELILVADYFNCGDGMAETYVLSEKQTEAFYEQLEEGLVKKEDKKANDTEEVPTDGGSSVKASLCMNGEVQAAYKLDLDAVGIELQDAGDMDETVDADKVCEIEGIEDLQYSKVWRETVFSVNLYEFEYMVQQQAEELLGEKVEEMKLTEVGNTCELQVETEVGEEFTFEMSPWGYITEEAEL
ncbi:MAG: hypothetical protein IJZ44_06440 [Lachnospiraceae bacterium]|nr:hypothetical protein [Lachnospiraceae bacterium]